MQIFVLGMVALAVFGGALRGVVVGSADLATAATLFSGIFVQAIPFLALGIMIVRLVAAFVTPTGWRDGCRADPRRRSSPPEWVGPPYLVANAVRFPSRAANCDLPREHLAPGRRQNFSRTELFAQ